MKKLFTLLMASFLCFPAFTVQEMEESTPSEEATEASTPATDTVQEMEESTPSEETTEASAPATDAVQETEESTPSEETTEASAPATDAVQETEESTTPEEAAEVPAPTTEDGTAALMEAARTGNTEAVRALIDGGVDVNAKTEKGTAALMFAASKGHAETVTALIDGGADVNAKTPKGTSALMIAAHSGHIEIVEILVGAGADVNAENEIGKTAMTIAASKDHADIVEFLKPEPATLPVGTVRVIGKKEGKLARWLSYGDGVDLKEYSRAYLGNITVTVEEKKKKIDKQKLAEMVEKELRANLEVSGYFSVVAADPPSEESQEKWLRIDADLSVDPGSRAARYWVGFGAGKSKSVLEVFFKDHETGTQVAKYHGKGSGSIGVGGGNAAKMTERNIRRNTEECAELWGQAVEGKGDSNAQ
jgi:ankyrin repeat protein